MEWKKGAGMIFPSWLALCVQSSDKLNAFQYPHAFRAAGVFQLVRAGQILQLSTEARAP